MTRVQIQVGVPRLFSLSPLLFLTLLETAGTEGQITQAIVSSSIFQILFYINPSYI
jgi:hypothetical protein